MTTPTPTPPPPPGEPGRETPASIMRFGELKKLIADTVAGLTGDNQPSQGTLRDRTRQPQQPTRGTGDKRNMDDEVTAALAKIEADKKRQERETARDKDIEDLKERTKERPPVERGRMHRFMGWGE